MDGGAREKRWNEGESSSLPRATRKAVLVHCLVARKSLIFFRTYGNEANQRQISRTKEEGRKGGRKERSSSLVDSCRKSSVSSHRTRFNPSMVSTSSSHFPSLPSEASNHVIIKFDLTDPIEEILLSLRTLRTSGFSLIFFDFEWEEEGSSYSRASDLRLLAFLLDWLFISADLKKKKKKKG